MGHEATRSRTLASGLAWIQAARRECQARLAAARDSGTIPGRPRLADLAIPCAVEGDWVTCPRDQRPDRDFLTQVVCEAE